MNNLIIGRDAHLAFCWYNLYWCHLLWVETTSGCLHISLYLWCFCTPLELLDGVAMWQCSKLDSQMFWWSWEERLEYCWEKKWHKVYAKTRQRYAFSWSLNKISVLSRSHHYFCYFSEAISFRCEIWVHFVLLDVMYTFICNLQHHLHQLRHLGNYQVLFFSANNTKMTWIFSFRHLELTSCLFWQTGCQLMSEHFQWHFHLFRLCQVKY